MNILDENIDVAQRKQLRDWKIHFRHIGTEIGRKGMDDLDEIIPLLPPCEDRPSLPATRTFINRICGTAAIVWFTLMSYPKKSPNTSVASCAILRSELRRSAWAKWFACATAGWRGGRLGRKWNTQLAGRRANHQVI